MTKTTTTYSVLFVWMGNICRSLTPHGVFRQKVIGQGLTHWVNVDSAGTHNYHPGSPPDVRSKSHAAKRGYDLSDSNAAMAVIVIVICVAKQIWEVANLNPCNDRIQSTLSVPKNSVYSSGYIDASA